MPSLKDVKMKIVGVRKTKQITKAMELVASSKMRKAKERAEAARPFFNILYETISDLSAYVGDELEIVDPYGGSLQVYGLCFEVLKNAIERLPKKLREEERHE